MQDLANIPKVYNPKEVEQKWYKFWEDNGYFKPESRPHGSPYTIVIPPPNLTGTLHLGQALNDTIQDIYIRWKRMEGAMTEWLPGMDHAGIATQVVVEKNLKKGETRESLGREKFVERVWTWVEEKRTYMITQLKRLGVSCDWGRLRFTFDEGLSKAVKRAFVTLYNKGLIYRGDYIVNWCPRCKTALSDDEVEHEDVGAALYYIKYPLVGKKNEFIQVATTRPETMLGDTAVAVNPKDKRYKKYVRKKVLLPLMNREIPVIEDELVDPTFGTGAVKVTPAHDPDDFNIGERVGLEKIIIMDETGKINENGGNYKGMDRYKARDAILSDLKDLGLLVRTEPYTHSVGRCYRCETIIEPYLSKQWFVKMPELAKPGIDAVENGDIKFHPKRWTGVYINWMRNIRDWCISRQIWWGHRIPVYYCNGCNEMIVAENAPTQCLNCSSSNIYQDSDVLDTWFSSWLWPFSTFGWPDKTRDLEIFYPTDLLVTASEIIFFWVARMIMAGFEFMGEIPFKDVYIHGTVRDALGRKMSRSLGNGIDPLEIIEKYGTDALRFSLIAVSGEGQDPHISENTFEIGRNFANKIWNAYRLIQAIDHEENGNKLSLADKWILSRHHRACKQAKQALKRYKINEAAMTIYDFFWHEFCDWYLESIKISRRADIVTHILERTLRLMHPFIPFITEEIWQRVPHEGGSIMVSDWPKSDSSHFDAQAEKDMEFIKELVTTIRNTRASFNIPHDKKISCYARCQERERSLIRENEVLVLSLADINEVIFTKKRPKECATQIISRGEIFIPLKRLIDPAKEKERIEKEINKVSALLDKTRAKLLNSDFLSKAPESVVKNTKEKKKVHQKKLEKLKKELEMIIGKSS
jgi:valyl-tRNA synthetase